jgi:uncharacterized OB-fold protein
MNPEVSAPFWAGTKKHEIWLQYSKGANKFMFPPREVSPGDLTPMEELVWTKVSGKGRIYSYTTIYQPAIAAFAEEAPYVHALIQLDEGVRMVRNNSLQINTRVEAVFEDVTPDWTLVKWRRIEE